MRLGIVTTLHGRPRLTRIMGRYYDALNIPGVELVKAAAYSHSSDAMPLSGQWETVYWPNNPRSDKWNAASRLLAEHEPDFVMVIGSDDFIHRSHIQAGVNILRQPGLDLVHPDTCHFFDTATRRLGRGIFRRVGAGRMLKGSVAAALDWELWEPGQIRNIDYSMGVRMAGIIPKPHPAPLILDVKVQEEHGRNIWSYDHLRDTVKDAKRPRWEDIERPQEWLAEHFPTVANDLYSYHDGYL